MALFYFYSFINADSGAFCLLFLAWDAGVDGLIHEIDLWARGVVFTISDQPFGQDLLGCVCDVCKVGKSNWYCIPVPQLMMVVVGASKSSFSAAKTLEIAPVHQELTILRGEDGVYLFTQPSSERLTQIAPLSLALAPPHGQVHRDPQDPVRFPHRSH